jgi:hypothetical protein
MLGVSVYLPPSENAALPRHARRFGSRSHLRHLIACFIMNAYVTDANPREVDS